MDLLEFWPPHSTCPKASPNSPVLPSPSQRKPYPASLTTLPLLFPLISLAFLFYLLHKLCSIPSCSFFFFFFFPERIILHHISDSLKVWSSLAGVSSLRSLSPWSTTFILQNRIQHPPPWGLCDSTFPPSPGDSWPLFSHSSPCKLNPAHFFHHRRVTSLLIYHCGLIPWDHREYFTCYKKYPLLQELHTSHMNKSIKIILQMDKQRLIKVN